MKILLPLILILCSGKIMAADTLNVDFDIPSKTCENVRTYFKKKIYSNVAIANEKWIFSKGIRNWNLKQDFFIFTEIGQCDVKLVVTTVTGLKDSLIKTVNVVYQNAQGMAALPDTACLGETLNLHFYASNKDYYKKILWTVGRDSFKTLEVNFSVNFTGQKNIKLYVLDTVGCVYTNEDSVYAKAIYPLNNIEVLGENVGSYMNTPVVCTGMKFQTRAKDNAGNLDPPPGAQHYWDWGGVDTSSGLQPYKSLYTSTTRTFVCGFRGVSPNYCMNNVKFKITVLEDREAILHASKVQVSGVNYFKISMRYSGIELNNITYPWMIINGKDTTKKNSEYLLIPDTFKSLKGVQILTEMNTCYGRKVRLSIKNFTGIVNTTFKAFHDMNEDGKLNGQDTLLKNVSVSLQSSLSRRYFIIYTDSVSIVNYESDSFEVSTTLMHHLNLFYKQKSTYKIWLSEINQTFLIPFKLQNYKDFAINYCGIEQISRGGHNKSNVYVKNISLVALNNYKIRITIDTALTLDTMTGLSKVTNGIYIYNFQRIAALNEAQINLRIYANPNKNKLGDKRKIKVELVTNTDFFPNNDKDSIEVRIVAPYDPNLKHQRAHYNKKGEIYKIQYIIECQNEGNANAINVELRDTLSNQFQLEQLKILGSSHPITNIELDQNNILIFSFNKMYLTPKSVDEIKSKGWVAFELDLKQPLAKTDSVLNRAGIYFDYEDVVLTPYAVTKYSLPSNRFSITDKNLIVLYPNPVIDDLQINDLPKEMHNYSIIDLKGKTIQQGTLTNKINVKNLTPGFYIFNLKYKNNVQSIRFLKS